MKEIPELYDIARQITNDAGMTWTDPRNGKHYPPEEKRMPSKNSITQNQTKRIEHEGQHWDIQYKIFPDVGELRVYRVMGDVTKPELLREALQVFAGEQGLRLLMSE